MAGYTRQEVQKLLVLSEGELRGLLRAGIVVPSRGSRRSLRFTFQDLVVLRAAKELLAAQVSPRRIKRVLRDLKDRLPHGAALSRVHVAALGDEVVVRDEGSLYVPGSGQLLFDFGIGELSAQVRPLAEKAVAAARRDRSLDAEGWYLLGCELDDAAPLRAREAYQRALSMDPVHVEAQINLGRLLHEAGELAKAAVQYRRALALDAKHAVAAFNLGVVLEDLGKSREAAQAYQQAIDADPGQGDAHHNLAHLLERLGQPAAALRHLATYRRLLRGS